MGTKKYKAELPEKLDKKVMLKLRYWDLEILSVWARYRFAVKRKEFENSFKDMSDQFSKYGGTEYQSYIDENL